MKIYLIGTGINGISSLTREAADAIDQAELLIGAERMLEPYRQSGKKLFSCSRPVQIADYLSQSQIRAAAVLLSGDCSFFSGAKTLLELLEGNTVSVIPGISSVSAMCARIGIPYEDMKFVSLHGKHANIAIHTALNRYCFFLLGGNVSASELCSRLSAYPFQQLTVHIASDLGYPNESVLSGKPEDYTDLPARTLEVVVTDNPQHLKYIPSAIPDDSFIRGSKPMTKAEVRCCAVAALQIEANSICWDIGCGTGSVSVEMAFRCPDGHVYAFDLNNDAVCLTNKNAQKFCCDHISVIEGMCPDILADVPPPDRVFIGGSSGKLRQILQKASEYNPNVHVMVTAVSLETVTEAAESFRQMRVPYHIRQISVTHMKRIGNHTMPQVQNPIFLIEGDFSCKDF